MFFRVKNITITIVLFAILLNISLLDAKVQSLKGSASREFRSGNLYLQQEMYDRAKQHYINVLNVQPDHVESMKNVAELYFEEAQWEDDSTKAIELFETAHGYYARVIETILTIPGWETYTNANKKITFPAIKNDSELKMQSIWVRIFNIGEEYYKESDWENAERIYEYLITLDPKMNQSYMRLADIAHQNHDIEKAIGYLIALFEADPSNTQILVNLALEYEAMKDWDNAKLYYQKIVDIEPQNIAAYLSLGFVNLQKNDYATALENYEQALQIEPNNIDIIANAASVAQSLSNDAKALEYLIKLYQVEETEENLSILCYQLAKMQNWAQLITYCKLWHEMVPDKREPVQFIVMAANQINDSDTVRRYQTILNNMK